MQFRVRFYRENDPATYWYTDGWYDMKTAREIRNDAWKFGLSAEVLDYDGFIHG